MEKGKHHPSAEIIFGILDSCKIQTRKTYTLDPRNTFMESKDSFNLN